VRFSPDGQLVFTGSDDNKARLWEVKSGKLLRELPHDGNIRTAAFSPDSRLVFTAGAYNKARLWEPYSGKLLGVLPRFDLPQSHRGYWKPPVAFSPNGRFLITGDLDRAQLWKVVEPVPDEPARLRAWVRARTGRAFDDRGVLLALSYADWIRSCRQLEAVGGEWQTLPPASAWHRHQVAQANRSKDWFAVAFHLDRLLAQEPANLDLRLQRGRLLALFVRGRWDEAVADLTLVLRSQPDHTNAPFARFARAYAHTEQGQWAQAVPDLSFLWKRKPDEANLWYFRGSLRAAGELWDGCVADYTQACRLQPNNPVLGCGLGLAYLGRKDEEAYRRQRRALLDRFCVAWDPRAWEPRAAIALAALAVIRPLPEKDVRQVLELAEWAYKHQPSNWEHLMVFGAALYRAGKDEEAVKQLSQAAAKRKGGTAFLIDCFLALAYQRLGKADKAKQHRDAALGQQKGLSGWQMQILAQYLLPEVEKALASR
jgi:tetratricopeptide (TPR) repeat protein